MRDKLRANAGFTLVELLVVMVILGILVSLVVVAATRALGTGQETQIKLELDNIALALEHYKNTYGSYPPNCVTPGGSGTGASQWNAQLIQRHIKKAFPRSKDDISALVENLYPAEAVVFWLAGFSSDPERPFSGLGGPTVPLDDRAGFDFAIDRIGPRDDLGNVIPRPVEINKQDLDPRYKKRVVLLYVYRPPKLTQPFVYFDTSKSKPTGPKSNWPANDGAAAGIIRPYVRRTPDPTMPEWVEPKKFQVISAGLDDQWGGDFLTNNSSNPVAIYYPLGPYVDPFSGHADNLVNFTPRTLADSQP